MLAKTLEKLPHSQIREIAHLAMEMEGVTRLYFGESNLPTPDFIKEGLTRAVQEGHTFYTPNAGVRALREGLVRNYETLHNVKLSPENIVITASGVQALNVLFRAIVDPGDEVLVLSPAWPNGAAIVEMFCGRPVEVPYAVQQSGAYEIDFDRLESSLTPRTKALIYTSPSNPIGWVATEEDQQNLLAFARRHGIWLIADEVYERLSYERPVAPSILRMTTSDDLVAVVQSFSKTYCMTGWRVGWVAGPKFLCDKLTQLNEYIVSHAGTMNQMAALTALNEGESYVVQMVQGLRENRDYALSRLEQMSRIRLAKPEGAFYLFPKVEGLTDSIAFCKNLLIRHRVGLAPGVAFGTSGEGSIRICYASERSVLERGLNGLEQFLNEGESL